MTVSNRSAYIIMAVSFGAVAIAVMLGFGDEISRGLDWLNRQIDSL